jgi:thioredoxin-like negative regulator of GroEL
VIWLAPTLALLIAGAAPGKGVRWERDVDAGLRQARKTGKPLMVDFFAVWCGWCRRLDRSTYVDPEVVRLSAEFVAVKVNTEGSAREVDVTKRYEVGSLPTVVFLSPEGHLLLRVDGYQGPGVFPETMRRARRIAARVRDLETALRRDPDDGAALTRLGQHLFEQESLEASRDVLQRAVKRDASQAPEERKRSRMYLALILLEGRRFSQAETLLNDALELGPREPEDAKLMFLLGRTYVAWGRLEQARLTWRRLLSEHPRSRFAQKANEELHALNRP